MQSTINGVTTQFVGEYYEVSGTDVTKYYGGQTATRVNGTVSYLLADHLGSNALILDSAGNVVGETRYKAWGEPRYISGATSDYSYTGQYSNTSDFGWMFYKARWYDPLLGRFNQADSIVPNPWDAASFDRYAYVKNNPIRFTDPSGHDVDCGIGDQYCNELIHEKADSSWPKQLPFRTYLKAKDSYEFFNINREEAIQADIDGDEDYMYATIYSEYVKLEWYYPYGLDVVLPEIDRAIVENDTEKYFALAGSLAILSIFDSDKGFGGGPGSESSSWSFGSFKSALKWQNQMKARGWTEQEITEALVSGQKIPALNKVNPGNTATRYVHPVNGKSVVLDDQTHEILHIGGINYEY